MHSSTYFQSFCTVEMSYSHIYTPSGGNTKAGYPERLPRLPLAHIIYSRLPPVGQTQITPTFPDVN